MININNLTLKQLILLFAAYSGGEMDKKLIEKFCGNYNYAQSFCGKLKDLKLAKTNFMPNPHTLYLTTKAINLMIEKYPELKWRFRGRFNHSRELISRRRANMSNVLYNMMLAGIPFCDHDNSLYIKPETFNPAILNTTQFYDSFLVKEGTYEGKDKSKIMGVLVNKCKLYAIYNVSLINEYVQGDLEKKMSTYLSTTLNRVTEERVDDAACIIYVNDYNMSNEFIKNFEYQEKQKNGKKNIFFSENIGYSKIYILLNGHAGTIPLKLLLNEKVRMNISTSVRKSEGVIHDLRYGEGITETGEIFFDCLVPELWKIRKIKECNQNMLILCDEHFEKFLKSEGIKNIRFLTIESEKVSKLLN